MIISLYNACTDQTIILETKTITIGRGFFCCDDKRISRNHGQITVLDNEIKLKSTHENPIFYKINLPVFKILKKDEEITLGHGHYFSLLPKQYVYEIRVTDTNLAGNQDTPTTSSNSQIINETDQNHNVKIDTSSPNSSSSSGTITFTVDTNDQMPQTSTSPFKTKRPANGECNEESTKKLKINEHFQKEIKIKPDPDAPVDQNVIPVCTVFPLIKPDPNGPSTSTSSVTTTVTSVKIEPPSSTVKSETVSTDNNASSDNPPRRARSVCEFGIRCYRMQTEHRRDHAHPGDADYRRPDFLPAPNDAPDCEYGASCYRRNPSHFVEFRHPPSTLVQPVPALLIAPRRNFEEADEEAYELFQANYENNRDEGIEDSDDDIDRDVDYQRENSTSSDDEENNCEE